MSRQRRLFYEKAIACMIAGEPYEGLKLLTKTLQMSKNEKDIGQIVNSFRTIDEGDFLGYEWALRTLLIWLFAKFPNSDAGKKALEKIKQITSVHNHKFRTPIVIVAGGCSIEVEAKIQSYKSFIIDAFQDFNGTIISGGTSSGVSGLIGELQQIHLNTIRTIGYVPKGKSELADKRYSEICFTDGEEFSPMDPLQYWIDIILSGVSVNDVRLLGINGGRISSIEYRIALALGSKVGLIKDSGMEADRLLSDPDWVKCKELVPIEDLSKSIKFLQTRRRENRSF
jgi:hypothetical protein